ncbi:MAG: galactosyltransferase-related protein [Solirubrobacteraceae bacterium]
MRVAVVTIARGRRRHLERQAHAVARLDPAPDRYVIVSLDEQPPPDLGEVVHAPVADGAPLPLAAARNTAIAAAVDADLVLCLDVDCLPERGMLTALTAAALQTGHGHLLCGPVGRLGPLPDEAVAPGPGELAESRTAATTGPRPAPKPGELRDEARAELFWSLSFAVAPATHARIGGFDEGYVGYGAEDTDYGFRARREGVRLTWVGGAWAHHQHHAVSDPPVEHVQDIVRNARRFRERWGTWPMEGWLTAFAALGLVDWEPDGDRLALAAVVASGA